MYEIVYEIEDGVPLLPDRRGRGGQPAIYPWAKLQVGQSFFAPGVPQPNIAGAAVIWARRHGGKFATRKCEKDGVPGTRVWRIE